MEFTTLGKLSIRIRLEPSDMDKYGVSYGDMDYKNARTKHIIWELLDKAKESAGFDTDGKRLHIQIFPSKQGGCELYISKLSCARGMREEKTYRFDSLEDALKALVYLKRADLLYSARLYSKGAFWYITADAELSEYGKRLDGALWQSIMREHGRFICGGGELARLIGALV